MAWNHNEPKRNEEDKSYSKVPSVMRGLVAGTIVVAVIAGVWMFSTEDQPINSDSQELSKPAIAEAPIRPASNVVKRASSTTPSKNDPSKIRIKTLSCATNTCGDIVERYVAADGKTHKLIRPSRPPIFTHTTDIIISMALAQNSSGAMPPLPLSKNMDEQFLRSLVEPIVIENSDTEDIKARKRIVRDARLEIKKMMDQGLHFSEIMADYEKLFNENAEIRANAIAEAKKIRDEGDTEGTAQYVDTMNAAFESMGIEKISMPKTKEERNAELEEKRAARAAALERKEN